LGVVGSGSGGQTSDYRPLSAPPPIELPLFGGNAGLMLAIQFPWVSLLSLYVLGACLEFGRSPISRYRARQLYKNISMLFLFPVKHGKLSTFTDGPYS